MINEKGQEVIAEIDIVAEKGYIYPTGRTKDGKLTILKIKSGRKAKK